MNALNTISIEGFKSIKDLKNFDLTNLNVLIGGNGAGKSNFIDVFRLLSAMIRGNLKGFVLERGGADGFFYDGPKATPEIKMHFTFGSNEYRFKLATNVDEQFIILQEEQRYRDNSWHVIAKTSFESALPAEKDKEGWVSKYGVGHYVFNSIFSWVVYHFHDTSSKAPMRRYEIVEHFQALEPNASNIAPFLLHLKTTESYQENYKRIVEAIRLAIPFFDDFLLIPNQFGEAKKVRLTWKQKGSDYPMQPYQLSDGSIRFICLMTSLLQPAAKLPSTIVIDEPELGLHPVAIEILADVIKEIAQKNQIIISTQSATLVDYFMPEDVIVVNRKRNETTFERLKSDSLSEWLEDYTLGELWQKNVVIGAPSYEL